jgi:hypothetical protein
MTACDGCGNILGFKKYRFHRMWRIEGKYCKGCMLELGKEFDQYGRITLSKKQCDLCKVGFYFLKSTWSGKQKRHLCQVCKEAVLSGVIPDKSAGPRPGKVPQVMLIFAGLGVLMMALGLTYTVAVAPTSQGNLLGILFGSTTTAMGFVLFKKTVRSRNLILGKSRLAPTTTTTSTSTKTGH